MHYEIEQFGRVDLSNMDLKPEFKKRWHGQIVAYDAGTWWSLAGRNFEGIGLNGGPREPFITPLNNEEFETAILLSETFFHRDFYTEDLETLKTFL